MASTECSVTCVLTVSKLSSLRVVGALHAGPHMMYTCLVVESRIFIFILQAVLSSVV